MNSPFFYPEYYKLFATLGERILEKMKIDYKEIEMELGADEIVVRGEKEILFIVRDDGVENKTLEDNKFKELEELLTYLSLIPHGSYYEYTPRKFLEFYPDFYITPFEKDNSIEIKSVPKFIYIIGYDAFRSKKIYPVEAAILTVLSDYDVLISSDVYYWLFREFEDSGKSLYEFLEGIIDPLKHWVVCEDDGDEFFSSIGMCEFNGWSINPVTGKVFKYEDHNVIAYRDATSQEIYAAYQYIQAEMMKEITRYNYIKEWW